MSLQCPHCKAWSAECEDLPREQEEWRPIRCGKCERLFAIKWQVEHFTSELSALPYSVMTSAEFLKEAEEA